MKIINVYIEGVFFCQAWVKAWKSTENVKAELA
jgi:hypothetical protein